MPSDQNLPATPKRRPRRAAATVAAGRLSNAFARQASDEADGPPRKRRRPLGARNDSSDLEGPSDVEMSSPPNSKSNPIVLNSSPNRAPTTGSTRRKPGTAQVVVELVASKRSKASSSTTTRSVPTPAPKPAESKDKDRKPGTYKTLVSEGSSSKSARLKTRRVRTIEENTETDYITEELMLEIWKEGIDRQAHQYAQEMAKKD